MHIETVNMHQAKAHLSRLVERAARGEAFIIAKAGIPMVKVVPLDAPEHSERQRLGFMAGEIEVPEDFDVMGAKDIESLMGGGE